MRYIVFMCISRMELVCDCGCCCPLVVKTGNILDVLAEEAFEGGRERVRPVTTTDKHAQSFAKSGVHPHYRGLIAYGGTISDAAARASLFLFVRP